MSQPDQESAASSRRGSRRAQLGSLVAIALSLMALGVSIFQARIAERQARASVWPYLSIGYSIYDSTDKAGLALAVDNNGLGPALIRSVVVKFDGQVLHRWPELYSALALTEDFPKTTSNVAGRVLPPNSNRETAIVALHVFDVPVAQRIAAAIDGPRFSMDVCYCSIYEDCWTAHWLQQKVDTVPNCPAVGDAAFKE